MTPPQGPGPPSHPGPSNYHPPDNDQSGPSSDPLRAPAPKPARFKAGGAWGRRRWGQSREDSSPLSPAYSDLSTVPGRAPSNGEPWRRPGRSDVPGSSPREDAGRRTCRRLSPLRDGSLPPPSFRGPDPLLSPRLSCHSPDTLSSAHSLLPLREELRPLPSHRTRHQSRESTDTLPRLRPRQRAGRTTQPLLLAWHWLSLLALLSWLPLSPGSLLVEGPGPPPTSPREEAWWIRHRRAADEQCLVLSSATAADLCATSRRERPALMRRTLLFRRGCSEAANMNLYQLLLLERNGLKTGSESDLKRAETCLSPGGLDCLSGDADVCKGCLNRVLAYRDAAEAQFLLFNTSVLALFQCTDLNAPVTPENRNAKIHRFSATFTCMDCSVAYQKWLLAVQSGEGGLDGGEESQPLWRHPPCTQWCKDAELACPHLASIKRSDYGGLPSFRCSDPSILSVDGKSTEPPNCVEPCEVFLPPAPITTINSVSSNSISSINPRGPLACRKLACPKRTGPTCAKSHAQCRKVGEKSRASRPRPLLLLPGLIVLLALLRPPS